MGSRHHDKGNCDGVVGTSITQATPNENDRVCSQCDLALPWTGDGGALEASWCQYCGRNVKPEYRGPHDRAVAFRNTLRELVKLKTVPEQVLEEIRACCHRNIWTSLLGSDGQRFKKFDDFCRDPLGLGCDPAPVKAYLTEWLGTAAFALAATPVAQQGRRTDRLAGTSRRNGEKSRPPRTDTRHRTIHSGPQILADAVGSGVLGKMNAEFLARYDAKNPGCTRFAAILRQVEEAVAKPKVERPSMKMAIYAQVQALKDSTPNSNSARRGQKQRNEVLTPPVASGNRAPVAPISVTDSLISVRPAGQEAQAGVSGDMLNLPESTGGESSAALLPVLAGSHGPSLANAPELRASFVDLLRAWRRMVTLVGHDLDPRLWFELLGCATNHEHGSDDEELFSRLAAELSGRRPSASSELVRESSLAGARARQDAAESWTAPHQALAPAAE